MNRLRYLLPFLLIGALIAGCKSDSTNPPAGNGPTINSFTATPSTVDFNTTVDSSQLKWDIDGATTVTIDQSVGDVSNNTDNTIAVYPSATTTYTLTAKNTSGTSTKTVIVTVTNNTGQPNSPAAPTQLTASAGSSSPSTITLGWTAPSGGVAATHYIIERWISGQQPDTINGAAPGPNSYNDAQLYPSFLYYYRIKAVSGAGAASAWSNVASAIAPGTAPSIGNITLSPATLPSSLAPGQTQQFTVVATDGSGNVLPIAAQSYLWTSSNSAVVAINQKGVATAGSTQGSSVITASLPRNGLITDTTSSNPVTVTVVNKVGSANTLVIFYGSDASDFTNYGGATSSASLLTSSGVTFDALTDFTNGGDPQFTLAQLTPYSRVVVLTGGATMISDNAISTLAGYAELGGKTLVIIGNGGAQQIGNATLQNAVGISSDDYIGTGDLNFTIQGQTGTAFSGLTFTQQSAVSYVDEISLSGPNAKAALVGTNTSDNSQVIIAMQSSILGGASKFLYSGANIDFVDPGNKNTFVKDFMNF
ncbi:MAG TPA: fibronectin type III domain-containing protein [Candidatus Kapabacteria bacterium]